MSGYSIYRVEIKPLSAFGTPLVGDTLFGQLCWTLRYQLGNEKLEELLQNYTEGKPFAVISDAFPSGYLPLPTLRSAFWKKEDKKVDIKSLKKKRWISLKELEKPVDQWQLLAKKDQEVFEQQEKVQSHNTINRETGTTGDDMFAPYVKSQTWYTKETKLDCYIVLDEQRLSLAELKTALNAIGQFGYGRDASIGLGKFEIETVEKQQWNLNSGKVAMTLASCAPQGLNWDGNKSWYQIVTRFGRHGDVAAKGKNPFKRPLLLAKAGAVFTLDKENDSPYIGKGLKDVSLADKETVHQGYAPVVYLPFDN